jgi:hypothetical protein
MAEDANSDPRLAERGIALRGQAAALLMDPSCRESDQRLVRRAIRNGWNIEPAKKARILARLMAVIDDEKADYADAISAARTLIAADSEDQAFQLSQEKSKDPASTQVNVQVNVGDKPTPITESERVAETLAVFERARERVRIAAERAANDEVHPPQADGAASGIPSP